MVFLTEGQVHVPQVHRVAVEARAGQAGEGQKEEARHQGGGGDGAAGGAAEGRAVDVPVLLWCACEHVNERRTGETAECDAAADTEQHTANLAVGIDLVDGLARKTLCALKKARPPKPDKTPHAPACPRSPRASTIPFNNVFARRVVEPGVREGLASFPSSFCCCVVAPAVALVNGSVH